MILSSRGDYGYDAGQPSAYRNHVESSIQSAFGYIGVTDVRGTAIEYDEFSDERLAQSVARATAEVKRLVHEMSAASS